MYMYICSTVQYHLVYAMYVHDITLYMFCQLRRQMTGRRLLCRSGACAELRLRLAGIPRLIWPDGK
jgi:hypothetical protein